MYERKECYSIPAVLSLVPEKKDKRCKEDFDGDMMKMCSDRYYTFLKSSQCAHCGIEGAFFAKERSLNKRGVPTSETYHFNMYAYDDNGNEVLMTKDHIIPRSRGGKDHVDNYTCMCTTCNRAKGSKLESEL